MKTLPDPRDDDSSSRRQESFAPMAGVLFTPRRRTAFARECNPGWCDQAGYGNYRFDTIYLDRRRVYLIVESISRSHMVDREIDSTIHDMESILYGGNMICSHTIYGDRDLRADLSITRMGEIHSPCWRTRIDLLADAERSTWNLWISSRHRDEPLLLQ